MKGMSGGERWVRLLLRLYPGRFRERFGGELLETYRTQRRTGRADGVSPAGLLRTTAGMLRGAAAEWVDGRPLASLAHEMRQALRSLVAAPGLSFLSVTLLGAGLALFVTFFAFVHSAFLRPLPYPEGDRLVGVSGGSVGYRRVSLEGLELLRDARGLSQVVAVERSLATVSAARRAVEYDGARVEPAFFETLGMAPLLGRTFSAREALLGEPVAVIGHDLWTSHFGGDAGVVGATVLLDDVPHRVIGVAPPGFSYGHRQQVWRPLDPGAGEEGASFEVLARLREGVTREEVRAELARLSLRLPETSGRRIPLTLLDDPLDRTQGLGPLPWVFLALAGLVLLVVCANVGGLLLARAVQRRTETAVRAALGASRRRLVAQSLVGALALAVAAGTVALALSAWMAPRLPALLGGRLPFWLRPDVGPMVVAVAAAATLATCLLFGVAPALEATRFDPLPVLSAGTPAATHGPRQRRLRRLGVSLQVGLSFVLVVAFALVFESTRRLSDIAWEVDVDRVLEAWVRLSETRYGDPAQAEAYWTSVRERLGALPEVEGVAMYGSTSRLRSGAPGDTGLVLGAPARGGVRLPIEGSVRRLAVDGRYFEVMGLTMLEGRSFPDAGTDVPEVVVSRSVADAGWPGGALGQRIRMGEDGPEFTIVGVSEDPFAIRSNMEGVRVAAEPHVFLPFSQSIVVTPRVLVRTRGPAADALGLVSAELAQVDPDQPVLDVETLRSARERVLLGQHIMLRVLGPFAACALAVALIGLYGLAAYEVAQRRREMGVRVTLGARGSTLVRLVLGDALRMNALGLVLGGALALVGARVFAAFLIVEAQGVVLLATAGAALLVVGVTALASTVPALRAARVDPLEALRGA